MSSASTILLIGGAIWFALLILFLAIWISIHARPTPKPGDIDL